MKTWLMYKNHYGKALPDPIYQSDLRKNRSNWRRVKRTYNKATEKVRDCTDCYPGRAYVMQLIVIGGILLMSMAVIAGYAPTVAQFFGW